MIRVNNSAYTGGACGLEGGAQITSKPCRSLKVMGAQGDEAEMGGRGRAVGPSRLSAGRGRGGKALTGRGVKQSPGGKKPLQGTGCEGLGEWLRGGRVDPAWPWAIEIELCDLTCVSKGLQVSPCLFHLF